MLCASPAYLKQHGTPQHPSELQQHQCLVLQAMDPWRLRAPDGSELVLRVVLIAACVAGVVVGTLTSLIVAATFVIGMLVWWQFAGSR